MKEDWNTGLKEEIKELRRKKRGTHNRRQTDNTIQLELGAVFNRSKVSK